MIASAVVGASAITVIQAGATAILLATGGRATAASHLGDAAIGAGLSLLVSQVLLSPNPVRLVEARTRAMLASLENAFGGAARALAHGGETSRLLAPFDEAMRHATDVTAAAVDAARGLEVWTVRGRWSRQGVERIVNRYDREATRLCASALLFGEALADASSNGPPPAGMADRLCACAEACAALSRGETPTPLTTEAVDVPGPWTRAADALAATVEALDDLIGGAPPTEERERRRSGR